MKAIIAAGGSGTRLRPLTFSSNKHLLPIANKPLLLYPLESILAVGIKQIGIIVNETRPAIEALLGDGSRFGAEITYIPQEKPMGLAHVVKISQDFLAGQPFVYHLGDNIFTQGIERPFRHFESTQPDALLTMVEHEENYRLGVPFFDDQGKLIKVVEKPENPPNKYGVPGLYFFNQRVFEAFTGDDGIKPSARGELEITDLYTYLLDHGYRVEAEEVDGRWMDPGKFDDMLDANAFLLDMKTEQQLHGSIDEASQIQGMVEIGHGSKIVNSRLVGPISIGQNCLIENSDIGAHVAIADDCTLRQIKIHNSVVMQESVLETVKQPIRDSLIGKQAHIKSDTQTGISLFIGDHSNIRLS